MRAIVRIAGFFLDSANTRLSSRKSCAAGIGSEAALGTSEKCGRRHRGSRKRDYQFDEPLLRGATGGGEDDPRRAGGGEGINRDGEHVGEEMRGELKLRLRELARIPRLKLADEGFF